MAPLVGGLMTVVFNDQKCFPDTNEDLSSLRNELVFWLLATILDGHKCAVLT